MAINRNNRGSTADAGAGATGADACAADAGAGATGTGAGATGTGAGAADAGLDRPDFNTRINSFIWPIVGLLCPSDGSCSAATLLTYPISLCNISIKTFITRGLDMDSRVD